MEHRFECTRCGACCRRPGYLALSREDLERIARFLQVSALDLIMDYELELSDDVWWIHVEQGEPCVFLDGDLCRVEAAKPTQCRTYPFWPEVLETEETWVEEAAHCPGIGIGRRWSGTEIAALLQGDRGTND